MSSEQLLSELAKRAAPLTPKSSRRCSCHKNFSVADADRDGTIDSKVLEKLLEAQTKADAASAMLNSEVFNQAFSSMNQGIVDQILQTPPEANEERERLYMMFKSGQMFVQQFATLINNLELRKQQEGE